MALLDTQVSVLANQGMIYLASGVTPHRLGNAHPTIVPYQVLPVSDGHFIVAVGNDPQFARFAKVLGAPELASDPRFLHNADRVRHRAELTAILPGLCQKFTRDALLAALEKEGVPAGPINTVADVFADPQVIARRMRLDLPDAAAKGGSVAEHPFADRVRWRAGGCASRLAGAWCRRRRRARRSGLGRRRASRVTLATICAKRCRV